MLPISEKRLNEILSSFSSIKPILVVGDVGIDKYTLGKVTRISPEAPVPILEVEKEWFKLGLAANVSNNFSAMKVPSTLFSYVGDDQNGELFQVLLEENKLKTWGIIHSNSRPTIVKERVATKGQQICRIDYETRRPLDVSEQDKLLHRIADMASDHSAIIVQDYGKGVISPRLVDQLVTLAHQKGIKIFADPNVASSASTYKGVDLLKPNLSEARFLANQLGIASDDYQIFGHQLLEALDLKNLVVTLGGDGIALFIRGEKNPCISIPTMARDVFDVSGAGDTVLATLVASLLCGASLEESAWIANLSAGVVVGKWGTATVSQDEVIDFYRRQNIKFNV